MPKQDGLLCRLKATEQFLLWSCVYISLLSRMLRATSTFWKTSRGRSCVAHRLYRSSHVPKHPQFQCAVLSASQQLELNRLTVDHRYQIKHTNLVETSLTPLRARGRRKVEDRAALCITVQRDRLQLSLYLAALTILYL